MGYYSIRIVIVGDSTQDTYWKPLKLNIHASKGFVMEDYAKVLIEKSRLSSLKESIRIGKQVLERKLAVYKKKIGRFEAAKGMNNKTFMSLFNDGQLDDNKEWLEWEHLANVSSLLEKKLDDIKNLKYEN